MIRVTCMMLCYGVRIRCEKYASGIPRAMSSTSPNSSRISQHLSRFVYEPGVRSPRKPGGPSRAGNVQTTPEKGAGPVPHTPSPKVKRSPESTSATTRSKSSAGKGSPTRYGTGHDAGNSTLDSIDASDMSDSTQRSSKRRRLDTPKEKTKKIPRGYAAPEVYAHLDMLPDRLREGLDVIFSGINPGKMSATLGHHFAHPTNKFWPALYKGGFTDKPFTAMDDHLMPELFNFGLTNLVPRPTSEAAELSAHEMRLAVPSLLEKLKRYRPGLVCFVGKGIWDKFEDIVRKASEAPEMAWESIKLSLPQDIENDGEIEDIKPRTVKLEEGPSLVSIDDAETLPNASDIKPETSPSDAGKKRKPKAAFDWTQPRSFKLVHPADGDRAVSTTLFWVVPSTSGLERTPREDLWRYFGLAKAMSERIKEGSIDMRMFREIKMDRVYEEVDKINQKAEDKARKSL